MGRAAGPLPAARAGANGREGRGAARTGRSRLLLAGGRDEGGGGGSPLPSDARKGREAAALPQPARRRRFAAKTAARGRARGLPEGAPVKAGRGARPCFRRASRCPLPRAGPRVTPGAAPPCGGADRRDPPRPADRLARLLSRPAG